jgi:hypothetical protein
MYMTVPQLASIFNIVAFAHPMADDEIAVCAHVAKELYVSRELINALRQIPDLPPELEAAIAKYDLIINGYPNYKLG